MASMLVALELVSGPVAIAVGAIVATTFALVKIFDDSEAKVNALKSAMEGFSNTLKGASLGSLEEYRKNLGELKKDSDEHLKTLKNEKTALEGITANGPAAAAALGKINEEIRQGTLANQVYADTIVKVDEEITAKQITFIDAQKFTQEALTAATVNQFAQRRQVAARALKEDEEKYAGHYVALYAATVKYHAEMRKIDEEERNFNQQLADQDFEQGLAKIKEQSVNEHAQSDEIDLVVLQAQREHYKEQYDAILAITGKLSNEQILKKKELETKLTQLEADETEKRIAIKEREASDAKELRDRANEITLVGIRTSGLEAGISEWEIAEEEIESKKDQLAIEQKLLDDQYDKEEISDRNYRKKKADLDLKAAQLEEEQAKAESKRDDAQEKTKKEKLDAEKQNRQTALEDFSSNLQEAGKLSKAAFEVSKAYEIAQTTISTYSSAQKAYEALIGIPVYGPVLAAVAAAAAIVAGMARVDQIANQNPTGYAFGGEVTGPTLALLGEGNDNEIVAPKRNFIQVWREDLLPLAIKDMREGKISGHGSTSDLAALRKEFADLKKTIISNRPITMISSDTDYTRFQKGIDRAARIKKMRIL
jgi:hypothetical protein